MSSQHYRYYVLNGIGCLNETELFQADSDAEAIKQIEALHPGFRCEIWRGSRLVAELSS